MYNNDRRIFMAVAAALALAAGSAATMARADDIRLSLAIWDPAQRHGVQHAIDAFEAAHPGITVALGQVPPDQYYTKLDAALGAGEGPDVMWQSSRASFYVRGGVLEPLDGYMARDGLSLAGYNPVIAELYHIDGKQYGIPKDYDAWALFYHAGVFRKLGVEPPATGYTWEDMIRIATRIRSAQDDATVVPLAVKYDWNSGVGSLMHSLGDTVLKDGGGNMASEAGVRALEMVRDLQDRELIVRIADSSDFNPVNALISGRLAMAVIPSWHFSLLSAADVPAGTFQALHLPAVNGRWMSDTNGLAYTMNAHSRHKDAAWKLIRFLTSDEGAILHARGGAGLPANMAPEARAAFVEANATLAGLEGVLATQQNYLRTTTATPAVLPGLPAIYSSIMPDFYNGQATAQETASKIDRVLDDLLQ